MSDFIEFIVDFIANIPNFLTSFTSFCYEFTSSAASSPLGLVGLVLILLLAIKIIVFVKNLFF